MSWLLPLFCRAPCPTFGKPSFEQRLAIQGCKSYAWTLQNTSFSQPGSLIWPRWRSLATNRAGQATAVCYLRSTRKHTIHHIALPTSVKCRTSQRASSSISDSGSCWRVTTRSPDSMAEPLWPVQWNMMSCQHGATGCSTLWETCSDHHTSRLDTMHGPFGCNTCSAVAQDGRLRLALSAGPPAWPL